VPLLITTCHRSNKEISDKINDQKRKKDSHDEKNARKAEVAREIQKLKDENTRRQEQVLLDIPYVPHSHTYTAIRMYPIVILIIDL
jgi:hypothetical protein